MGIVRLARGTHWIRVVAVLGTLFSNSVRALFLKRRQRGVRLVLLEQVRLALVYVQAGLDAEYAWRQTGRSALEFRHIPQDSPSDIRAWLHCVRDLHAAGAPVGEVLEALADYLESELHLELERHVESAPKLAQILLMVFFAPGAFFVLLYPWLAALW
jgi:hypothetical protein